jgi:hypothetical protein
MFKNAAQSCDSVTRCELAKLRAWKDKCMAEALSILSMRTRLKPPQGA